MIDIPAVIVLAFAGAAILASWAYFLRWRIARPPIGVFNLRDVLLVMGGIVLVPYLYLLLPLPIVGGLLVLVAGSILYFVAEPVLRGRAARLVFTLGLIAADLGAAAAAGTAGPLYLAINNLLVVLMVIGMSNLWAQSGMRARDVAILGGLLVVYDFIATATLPLMGETMSRMAGLPLGPQVAWPAGHGGAAFIGLGDLLLAAVFPLALRKAFGVVPGALAVAASTGAILGMALLPLAGLFPAMVVLGPLMIVQYSFWRRRRGVERTTWQYRQAEARPGPQWRHSAGAGI